MLGHNWITSIHQEHRRWRVDAPGHVCVFVWAVKSTDVISQRILWPRFNQLSLVHTSVQHAHHGARRYQCCEHFSSSVHNSFPWIYQSYQKVIQIPQMSIKSMNHNLVQGLHKQDKNNHVHRIDASYSHLREVEVNICVFNYFSCLA